MACRHFELLVQISDELSEKDLKNLVFCCGGAIPEAEAERIASGVDLFRVLKHQNHLRPGKCGYLRKHLTAIGRIDLASRLPSELESALEQVPSRERSAVLFEERPDTSLPRPVSPIPAPPVVSSRLQLLQVAADLTLSDVSRLAYLFADQLPRSRRGTDQQTSAVKLLLQLETVGAIHPNRPKVLASLLHAIGRKDLSTVLLSVHSPQSIQSSMSATEQLLYMKISMMAERRSQYSDQRKLLSAIAASDVTAFQEQIVLPVHRRLNGVYEYSSVHRLSAESFGDIRHSFRLDELFASTIPMVFVFMDSFLGAVQHYLSCDGGTIRMGTIRPLFRTCQESYGKFEDEICRFHWNTALRSEIQQDLAQRRTPIGSPALKAVSCVYELCRELSGGEAIQRAMQDADKDIRALDYFHHAYCCMVVLTQWLESVLCLMACGGGDVGSTDVSSISCDEEVLQATLLRLVADHREQISSVYRRLSGVIGEAVLQRISERMHRDGISIDDCHHTIFGGRDSSASSVYVLDLSTATYANLLLLVQFAYFGSKSLDLRKIFSRLKTFNSNFASSHLCLSSSVRLFKNLVRAYESQVEMFEEKALASDPVCVPALRHFLSSTIIG